MKIFVAYNTISFVEIIQIRRKPKYVKRFYIDEKKLSNNPLDDVYDETLRETVFAEILKKYKGNNELIFDILDKDYEKEGLYFHINKNRKKIEDSDLIVFVLSKREISFWQLQELYFASYFGKPIYYIVTSQFLKYIADNTLDKRIKKVCNKKTEQ